MCALGNLGARSAWPPNFETTFGKMAGLFNGSRSYEAEIKRKAMAPVASQTARDAQAFPHGLVAAHRRRFLVEIHIFMHHS
jgi:hypothetical protein